MSVLRDRMEEMIAVRVSMGYDGKSIRYMLSPFIRFCETEYPSMVFITKEMTDSWLTSQQYTVNTQMIFIASLKHLCRYLQFYGEGIFVPGDEYNIKRTHFEAHSLNRDELKRLFDAIDSYKPMTTGIIKHGELLFPVLFRMMFCLGLRPGEPMRLLREDVNLETGEVYIREAKRHRDRHIFMSNDLIQLCKRYDALMDIYRKYFFEVEENRIHTSWMTYNFKKMASRAGLPSVVRPYDLRHTFASMNLVKWLEDGREAMDLMPYLSQFMGHSTIESTCYYIHLLPEELKRCSKIDWKRLDDVYGGLDHAEA